jgi:GH43 family beta-xylosidase
MLLGTVLSAAACRGPAPAANPGDLSEPRTTYVVPPVVPSGWSLPEADGIQVEAVSEGPTVRVEGATLSTDAPGPARATVRVTLRTGPAARDTVTTAFDVTVIPRDRLRYLLAYTRTPLDPDTYGPAIANSMHLAMGADAGALEPLNENYGVLFARAVPTGRVDFNEVRTLRDPHLFHRADGTFAVVASRALADGARDEAAASSFLYFTSPDLRTFTAHGPIETGATGGVNRPRVVWDTALGHYLVGWVSDDGRPFHTTYEALDRPGTRGPIEAGAPVGAGPGAASLSDMAAGVPGAVPSSVLPIDAEIGDGLAIRFGRITSVDVRVPEVAVPAGGEPALDTVRATLTYSDGSTAQWAVDWDPADVAAVDPGTPGTYTVRGTIRQPRYAFPFIAARADPDLVEYDGAYYFIATNDVDGGHVGSTGMPIRGAASIAALPAAPEHTILATGPADIQGCFWAPELHAFAGTLHVFFAPCIGEASWSRVQAHVLRLEPGGDPLRAEDWEAPRPVLQADGSPLQLGPSYPGISLDMTYFEVAGTAYVAWSQRYIVGDSIGDAEIWIATVDPADPYRLTRDPVRLVTAEYGWDHNLAAVAEGPHVVQRDGTVYMTYSGSAVGPTYVTGLVTAPADADLLDPSAWSKLGYPVLKTDTELGQWGPGHNTFTTDEDGTLLLVYHAKTSTDSPERHTGLRRVHWAADGMPILDMAPDEAVAPGLRQIEARVVVQEP